MNIGNHSPKPAAWGCPVTIILCGISGKTFEFNSVKTPASLQYSLSKGHSKVFLISLHNQSPNPRAADIHKVSTFQISNAYTQFCVAIWSRENIEQGIRRENVIFVQRSEIFVD